MTFLLVSVVIFAVLMVYSIPGVLGIYENGPLNPPHKFVILPATALAIAFFIVGMLS